MAGSPLQCWANPLAESVLPDFWAGLGFAKTTEKGVTDDSDHVPAVVPWVIVVVHADAPHLCCRGGWCLPVT